MTMAGRRKIAAANWKMYKTQSQAREFAENFRKEDASGAAEIIICPPASALAALAAAVKGSRIKVGGQNMHSEKEGAFTGEVSGPMLKEVGCEYCIVGHSERRRLFGETDEIVNGKLKACLREGLVPIFCVGETLPERDAGKTELVVQTQLTRGLEGIDGDAVKKFVIAYEPVWAIGTGRNATPEQAQEVHAFIHAFLEKQDGGAKTPVPVLYGGSVKPDNIGTLIKGPDIDGALVGGASLEPKSFAAIVKGVGG